MQAFLVHAVIPDGIFRSGFNQERILVSDDPHFENQIASLLLDRGFDHVAPGKHHRYAEDGLVFLREDINMYVRISRLEQYEDPECEIDEMLEEALDAIPVHFRPDIMALIGYSQGDIDAAVEAIARYE